jgi:hypothetical protein
MEHCAAQEEGEPPAGWRGKVSDFACLQAATHDGRLRVESGPSVNRAAIFRYFAAPPMPHLFEIVFTHKAIRPGSK